MNVNHVPTNEATNTYHFNMDKINKDKAFDGHKSKGDDGCESDRRINQREHRSDGDDAYSNAHYERCPVSSSDDTSNKRKIISEIDVSIISFVQTSRIFAAKPNTVNLSITISTLDNLGNVGELSFTVISNGNVRSKYCNPSKNYQKHNGRN